MLSQAAWGIIKYIHWDLLGFTFIVGKDFSLALRKVWDFFTCRANLLLSLCSSSLKQYSQALSFSSCCPVFAPCRLDGNSLEKLNIEWLLWLFGIFSDLILAPVSSASRGKLNGVSGLDSLSLDNDSLSDLSGDLPKYGDWDEDWLPISCGEERKTGIVNPADDCDPMETLSMLDWMSWEDESDKWVDWLRFSAEPGFEGLVKISGEWGLLGEEDAAVILVNERCWSQDLSMEKLRMFKTWSGKKYWAVK